MIISRLTGGLGNQMFQYAAGLALAEHHRTTLKLDVEWFRMDPQYEAHNRYALSCFNITEQFATREEIDRVKGRGLTRSEKMAAAIAGPLGLQRLAESLRCSGKTYFNRQYFVRDPQFLEQPDPCYLHGMWQSESFFKPVENLLRLQFSFRYPPQPEVAEMEKKIRTTRASAFVHFRRGDYTRNPDFRDKIGVLEMDYYRRAIEELNQRMPNLHLFIFSDDIEAIAKEFTPEQSHTYVRCVAPWHPYDKIRLMAACDHGIIANSTFSWWGGWLNPNPDKIIIGPQRWRKDPAVDCRDALPDSWLTC